jgi:hypothetical protein
MASQAAGSPPSSSRDTSLDVTDVFYQEEQKYNSNPGGASEGPPSFLCDLPLDLTHALHQDEHQHNNTILDISQVHDFLSPQDLRQELIEEEWEHYFRLFDTASPQTSGFSTPTVLEPTLYNSFPLPTLRKKKRSMAVESSLPRFPCPIFQDEVKRSLPHTCNGGGGDTMSELRTHMTRGTKERLPHLKFLKRCKICNNDIIDETDFNDNHVSNCHSHHPIRKGEAADIQYQMFCATVLKATTVELKTSHRKCVMDIVWTKLILVQTAP